MASSMATSNHGACPAGCAAASCFPVVPDKGKTSPDGDPTLPAADSPQRRPRRRWGWWSLLALLVAITATAPTGWLPRLANSLIREYLRVRELSAIQVRVERLTPWNLRAAIQLGTNAPVSQIDCIDVRYSPGGLWHARLVRVEIDGGLLQFCVGSNGLALCGLPPDLDRLRPGASPVADEDAVPQTWQVGKVLLDNVTLRLLPPETNGLALNGGASSASPSWRRGVPPSRATSDPAPFDISLHASAVTDRQGETRFAVADYGRAGMLANGAVRLDTGDGWLVAVLPESDVQEWLRVAQWYVQDPRFQGSGLCAGNGGVTFLARMEQWRPALAQGDLFLRAATLLDDLSLTYDLRMHGVAQWEEADSLRPTISANADLGVRMASYKTVAWSDDRELPAHVSIALKLTPQRTEWECQAAARAVLSHEAAQACLPDGTVRVPDAPRLQLDGVFTSLDLASWAGAVEATAFVSQPWLPAGGMTFACSDLVVHVTASITNSQPAGVRGWVDTSGLTAAGSGEACAGEVDMACESHAPFDQVALTVTVRVASLTLPAGEVVFDNDEPVQATASASLLRRPDGGLAIGAARLEMAPWQAAVGNDRVGMPDRLEIRLRDRADNRAGKK